MEKRIMEDERVTAVGMRDSNIELMRIIIMFFIVFLHSITNAELITDNVSTEVFCGVNTIRGFLLVAVNCFVLISGYYGIKFKIKGLLNIYLVVLIYGAIAYFLHLYVDGQTLGKSVLFNTVFCISHSKLWFVPCYLGLYCLSPILNYAAEAMSKKEYVNILIILTIMNVYLGWFWRCRYFDPYSGFTIEQMVYVYFIGGYIRRFISQECINKQRYRSLIVYIVTVFTWSLISLHTRSSQFMFWQPNTYNNPFIIISSLAFFVFFLSFHFKCRTINFLAKGVFAVYVVHDGAYYGNWFKKACQWFCGCDFIRSSTVLSLASLAILAVVTVLIIASLDAGRRAVTDRLLLHIPSYNERA